MSTLTETLTRHLQAFQDPGSVYTAPKVGPDAPSEKQVNYYKALVEKKNLNEIQRADLRKGLNTYTRKTICIVIGYLMGLDWAPRPVTPVLNVTAKISQGYYAVNHPDTGVLKFYSVRKPTDGKWAGYAFLSEMSGENYIPMRDRGERDKIFLVIAQDATGALKRFGKEIGRCGHCKKQLTDEISREFGIGPVCRKELGL